MAEQKFDYDYIIIGSGFGGSVSALRLAEKGYKMLVLEKGKCFRPEDFPRTNWNLKKWLWLPFFRFFGLFKLTFFRHVATLSGVGVGGGPLVYDNTLPVPKTTFFKAETWGHLADFPSLPPGNAATGMSQFHYRNSINSNSLLLKTLKRLNPLDIQ